MRVLFLAKTNEKDACFRVPQSSSLPGSHAQKSSGVEIECDGCWGGARDRVFWRAGLVAGLQVGWALNWVFWLFGFGVSSSSPLCSWAPNLHKRLRH